MILILPAKGTWGIFSQDAWPPSCFKKVSEGTPSLTFWPWSASVDARAYSMGVSHFEIIALAASSTFGPAIFSSPLSSKYFLMPLWLTFYFTHRLARSVLFHVHKCGYILVIFSLLSSDLILQYSQNIHCLIFNLWNVLRHNSWSRIFW